MDDSIRNLPPAERVKALRELQERKRRELEELEKKRAEELEEAEEQVRASLDEIEDDEREAEERAEQLRKQLEELEEQTLEEMVEEEKVTSTDQGYLIPQEQQDSPGYTPINQIVDDLNRLSYTDNWNSRDQDLYQQRKEELSQTSQYRATLGDDLVNQLDTAKNIMQRLGYRH